MSANIAPVELLGLDEQGATCGCIRPRLFLILVRIKTMFLISRIMRKDGPGPTVPPFPNFFGSSDNPTTADDKVASLSTTGGSPALGRTWRVIENSSLRVRL